MQESQHFCGNYITKFSIDLGGIGQAVEKIPCNEPQSHYILFIQYSRERTKPMYFRLRFNAGLYFDIYGPIFSDLFWLCEQLSSTFLVSVDALVLHSYKKSKTSMCFFSEVSLSIPMKFTELTQPVVL